MKQSIANALLDIGAVGISPDAPITFKSGLISPVYVDNRALLFHPDAWRAVIKGLQALIDTRDLRFDVIAGVAVGGVPHSSALAFSAGRPSVFIRKEAKGHGKGNRIEGGGVLGRSVLLVEDLVTTGGSSLSAVAALRAAGADVSDVLAIVSYEFPEANAAFESADVRLHTLTDFDTLLAAARQRELIRNDQDTQIRAWLADPRAWAPAGR